MPVSAPTLVGNYYNTDNQNPYDSNDAIGGASGAFSFAMVAGRRYYALIHSYSAGAAELPSSVVFDPGGADESTWTVVTDGTDTAEQTGGQGNGGDTFALYYFDAPANTGTSFLRVTFGATQSAAGFGVWYVTGHASGTGATIHPQVNKNTGSSTTADGGFTSAPASDGLTLFCVGINSPTGTVAALEGRTELYENDESERNNHALHYEVGGTDTTLTATVDPNQNWGTMSVEVAAAVAGFELNAEPGSFALTGAAAGALSGRLLSADPGAYTLTGQPAELSKGFSLHAEPGAYALSGLAAELLAARQLPADPGAYALTGLEAGLLSGRLLSAEPGAYALTGFDAAVLAGRLLAGDPGVYLVTGADAALVAARVLSAEPGVYVLTGNAAELIFTPTGGGAFELNAEPGSYALTGAPAGALAARVLAADPGAYILTGQQAAALVGRFLAADPGAYAVVGTATALEVARLLAADPGAYLLVGAAATLSWSGEQETPPLEVEGVSGPRLGVGGASGPRYRVVILSRTLNKAGPA